MEYNKDYIQEISSVEDMPIVAQSIVSDYCEIHGVEEGDIFPSIWNDILTELQEKLFNPCKKILKLAGATHNDYDRAKVLFIYDKIYKRLCNQHCQEISLTGFCEMSGIPKQNIYSWSDHNNAYNYIHNIVSNTTYNSSGSNSTDDNTMHSGVECNNIYKYNSGSSLDKYIELLSSPRFNFHEIIMSDNEESLFSLMKDRRYHPMKVLPKLNKVHGWNMSGVSAQATRQALTDAQLPRLDAIPGSAGIVQNAQNCIESDTESTIPCSDD